MSETDNTDNIVKLPRPLEVLADCIRSAHERTERGRQEWVEGMLELADALVEARQRFRADRLFAVWLAENELDQLGENDRAALLKMGAESNVFRDVLIEQDEKLHPITILRKNAERFGRLSKPEPPPPHPEKRAFIPGPSANAPSETTPPATPTKPLSRQSPFQGLPRAEEVAATYLAIDARTAIGKAIKARGGKEIWSLILMAMDAGFLTATEASFTKTTLRILFPNGHRTYCGRFDLTNAKERQHVRDQIMPAAIANRDAVLAAPDQLEHIVTAHCQRQQEVAREAAAKQTVNDALRAMPPDQREVLMYGVRLWPRVEHQYGTYDYDQLRAAIWYFRDFDGWIQGSLSGNSPASRAIIARLSTKWPQEYVDRAHPPEARQVKKVYQLVHLLARLLEQNPEGECVIPPSPKIEGQW